jgi:hypothetical protein
MIANNSIGLTTNQDSSDPYIPVGILHQVHNGIYIIARMQFPLQYAHMLEEKRMMGGTLWVFTPQAEATGWVCWKPNCSQS